MCRERERDIYIYIYTYIYMRTHTHIHIYIYIHIHVTLPWPSIVAIVLKFCVPYIWDRTCVKSSISGKPWLDGVDGHPPNRAGDRSGQRCLCPSGIGYVTGYSNWFRDAGFRRLRCVSQRSFRHGGCIPCQLLQSFREKGLRLRASRRYFGPWTGRSLTASDSSAFCHQAK